MNDKQNIFVLCTGNSCRSQIAEGYFRHYAGDRFNVFSAGTEPKEKVHLFAVTVMEEDGIDLAGQHPKHLKEYLGLMPVAHVVIVCGGADESCPRIWPGMGERLYWPFDDPAAFHGSEEETLGEFRRIRDEIKQRILTWVEKEESEHVR